MADLKTDYKDDVLDTSVNEKRKFKMIQNADGTVSFEDVTEYTQTGDSFGAADINATNAAVNEVNSNLDYLKNNLIKQSSCQITTDQYGNAKITIDGNDALVSNVTILSAYCADSVNGAAFCSVYCINYEGADYTWRVNCEISSGDKFANRTSTLYFTYIDAK